MTPCAPPSPSTRRETIFETGLCNVDVWVDFETADKVGCVIVGPVDAPDLELLKPDKVVVASDEDHIALAVVVGRVRQGSETATSSGLLPGTSRSTSRQSCARSVVPAGDGLP